MNLFKKKNTASAPPNSSVPKQEKYNRICLECREPLKPHFKYCPGCGLKLNGESANTQPSSTLLDNYAENSSDPNIQKIMSDFIQYEDIHEDTNMDSIEFPDLNTIRQVTKDLEKFDCNELENISEDDYLDEELDENWRL